MSEPRDASGTQQPPPPVRSPLTREFLGLAAIAVAVVVGIHLLFVSSNRMVLEGKLEDSRRIGGIVAAIITKEMREHAPHRVQRHLTEIPLGEDLVALRVFESSGRLVFAVGDDRLGQRLDRRTDPLCRDCHGIAGPSSFAQTTESPQGLPIFRVDFPIRNEPECRECHAGAGRYLGNLLIETTFTPLEVHLIERRRTIAWAGGAVMLLTLVLLGLLLHVRILRPLGELFRGVQKARSGDLAVRVPERREDEIGFLARSFNETIEATQRHQDGLEQKVAERTAELEHARMQMAHRENLAALGRLAAGMAHEIGNPLSAISTLCQLVARRRREDPFVSEQVGLISANVRRLTDLTARMMDLARPTSLDQSPVDVNEVVQSACNLARMDSRLAKREMRFLLAPDLPRVRSHPDVLIQSILNLILNAADASPDDGLITVSTAREGRAITIAIRDEGGGVTPELERVIFEPFFTTKPPDRGSGLGLSVSLGLLRSIGADLQLRNEPGRGATFVISMETQGGR